MANDKPNFDNYQKAAINIEQNAVVSAGAGSGKTTVLSERFLHLIQKENGYNVDEILTLTFTKKATVEMSDRIYKVLKQNAPEQAANFYKANIKTIDSYCNSVAKIGAHLYGVSPDFTQDDEAIKNQAFEKALPFILEHRENIAIKELVNTKDYAQIAQELFVNPILYNSTIAEPIDFDETLTRQIKEIVAVWNNAVEETDSALRLLVDLYNSYPGNRNTNFMNNLKSFIEDSELPGPVKICEEDFINYQTVVSDKLEAYAKSIYNIAHISQAGTRGDVLAPLKETLNSLKEKDYIFVGVCNFAAGIPLTKEIIPLFVEFQEIINNIKRSNSVLTFKDVSNMALCILRDHPDIRLLEKQKYKAIMIDEFQDNNSMQRDMLFLLAEKPERMDVGIPTVDELCPDKLFFVGDEKQSIYIFRGADVSVFRALSDDFKEGNLEMTTNYRSNPALIGAFNTIFGGYQYPPVKYIAGSELVGAPSVFYNEKDISIRDIPNHEAIYHEVTLSNTTQEELEKAGKENKEKLKEIYNPKVHVALYDNQQEVPQDYISGEEAEAEWVAQKIDQLIAEGTNPSEIAILFRNYSLQSLYERTFLRHGIPYNTEVVTGLYADGPINDLMAFIQICVEPQNTIAYAQVLRSPLVNLSLPETMGILSTNKEPFAVSSDILEGKSAEIYKKMQSFYMDFSKSILSQPIAKSVSALWYELGYRYETMWNHTVEMYGKLYDLLFELARQADLNNMGLVDFIDTVNNYRADDSKLENMDIPLDQTAGVHIMSIHKSKGLEFETVFVCATHRGPRRDNNAAPVFCSPEFGITVNTPPCKTFDGNKTQYFYDKIKEEKDLKLAAELRRITYVALTRAKKNLYITNGKYKQDPKAYEKFAPGGQSNVDSLFKVLSPVIEFYRTEGNQSAAPFDLEMIPSYPRFANDGSESTIRKNTISAKKLLVGKIEQDKPYDVVEKAGGLIVNQKIVSKYTTPSHLHGPDEENSVDKQIISASTSSTVYPEITQYVLESISPEEYKKHELDKSYEPRPAFSFANFGTIAHAYMEAEMKHCEPDISNKEWVGLDNNSEKIAKIRQICEKMAENFKKSAIGQAAIRSTEYYPEYEFRSKVGSKIVKGIMDLVFKNDDGTYTILDYKTNQKEEPEIYYNQLACYRQAIAQMLNIEDANSIKCYLFYLRSGHEVDISAECAAVDLEKAVNEITA